MHTLRLPTGLIRYGSQDSFERTPPKRVRLRLVAYPIVLLALIAGVVTLIATRTPLAVTQLRVQDQRFVVRGDEVRTPIRIRVDNRHAESVTVTIDAAAPARIEHPITLTVPSFGSVDGALSVVSQLDQFVGGRRTVTLHADTGSLKHEASITVLGPLSLPPRTAGGSASEAQSGGASR